MSKVHPRVLSVHTAITRTLELAYRLKGAAVVEVFPGRPRVTITLDPNDRDNVVQALRRVAGAAKARRS